MNRTMRKAFSILLSLMICAAYLPAGSAWAVDDASEKGKTEAAGNTAASDFMEKRDVTTAVDNVSNNESKDISSDESLTAAGENEEAQSESSDRTLLGIESAANVTVDDKISNGAVDLAESGNKYLGTAAPANGYDLATVRQLWTDAGGDSKERYLEYTRNQDGTYSFEVTAEETDSVVTAYFYDLNVWDGTVDLTWYDPDQTEYEISTPAQLAGLAAITNGMVDEAVTEEYMIKDNAGRSFADGNYSHKYISTEPAEVDLLTPNHSEGAGQVRDIAWRLPETEKNNKLAEDDTHNDFMYRTVRLTADIDMGDKNWTPIGGKYAMNRDAVGDDDAKVIDTRFQGIFDGQGHSVKISCDRMAKKGFAYAMEIAFIGYLGGGVDYKNGYPKDTYMEYAKYWVPTIRNVVVRGDVKGRRMVAGVVGRTGETNYGVLVENCANFTNVYATDMRGCAGIVGAAWGKAVIRNCYNAGTIRSNFWEHGGIVGSNGYEGSEDRDPAAADIYNCYNSGTTGLVNGPTGTPRYDGQEIGVDGQAFAAYKVSNCFYATPETAIEGKAGYSTGDTSKNKKAKVTEVEAVDLRSDETLARLNANGAVFVKDTKNINNGCPVLWFQGASGSGTANVTLRQTSGGTIASPSDLTRLAYGTTVELTATADKGKRLNGYKVIFADSSQITIPANGFYTVSGRNVTIEGIFGERALSAVRFIEKGDGAPYYIEVKKIKDAEDRDCDIELKSGSQVEMGDIIKITPKDINLTETQPDIKYLEYTGKFGDPAYPDWSLDVVSKAQRTYKVTGDVEDIDITVSPKTRGKQWTTVADTSWYSAGSKSFTLNSARQLAGLAKLCSEGNSFEGVTIRLGGDISLENTAANSGDVYGYERSWIGIGTSERYPFKGIFDGQGHTVKYMHRNFAPGYCDGDNGGLFGVTDGALIKNVTVEGGSYVNDDKATMVCGFINGANGGSIAGTVINTTIENCTGRVPMSKAFYAGGIAGTIEGNTVIRDCSSDCDISGTNESIGGIVGKIGENGPQIIDCTNYGDITTTSWKAGGILGSGETYSAKLLRCVNNGSVSTSMKGASNAAHAAGGIFGYAGGALTCSQCINKGDLRGDTKTYALGGIGGTLIKGVIEDCYNTGEVFSESTSGGAEIAGITNFGPNRLNSATVCNCYNTGKVSIGDGFRKDGYGYGGVIGYGIAKANTVVNAYCSDASVASIGGKAGPAGTTVNANDLKELRVTLGDSFVRDRNDINDGFPVLMWQDPNATAVTHISSVKKASESSAAITWTSAGPRDGFELYRSVNGGTETKVYSGPALSYTDSGLTVGNMYRYRVRAFRVIEGQINYGEWSEYGSLELLLAPMKLKSVKNNKKGSAEIKWKQVKNAAGYEIYRSMTKDGGYKKIKTVKVTKKNRKTKTLSFINKKLKKKKTYFFKIRYYRNVNGKKVYSEYSPVKKIKIKK